VPDIKPEQVGFFDVTTDFPAGTKQEEI